MTSRMTSRAQGAEPKADQGPSKISEDKLDEALALTFPASDPPSQTQAIVHVGVKPAAAVGTGTDRR